MSVYSMFMLLPEAAESPLFLWNRSCSLKPGVLMMKKGMREGVKMAWWLLVIFFFRTVLCYFYLLRSCCKGYCNNLFCMGVFEQQFHLNIGCTNSTIFTSMFSFYWSKNTDLALWKKKNQFCFSKRHQLWRRKKGKKQSLSSKSH